MRVVLFAVLLGVTLSACRWWESWDRCGTAPCRARTVEAAYAKDPQRVLVDLAAMVDPIEQVSLVEQLAHAFPQNQAEICGVAPPDSPAWSRCQQMRLRPHLFELQRLSRSKDNDRNRPASGPAESEPMRSGLAPLVQDAAIDVAVIRGECGQNSPCIADAARTLAGEGRAVEAAASCHVAWPEGTLARSECLFTAAEALIAGWGDSRLTQAMALCDDAGPIARNCVQHVLIEAIPTPPPADAPDQVSVQRAIAGAAAIRDAFGEPQRGYYTQFYWAVWTRDAYASANRITGHLLGVLPDEAAPHVRSAAAWQYAQFTPGSLQDLDQAVDELEGALRERGELEEFPADEASMSRRIEQSQPNAFWTSDRDAQEAAIPAVLFLGSGRRATAADPTEDLRIAVLEAAARTTPPVSANALYAVLSGTQSQHVRWTAARLLATLYGAAVIQEGVVSEDPLVQAGLQYAQGMDPATVQ